MGVSPEARMQFERCYVGMPRIPMMVTVSGLAPNSDSNVSRASENSKWSQAGDMYSRASPLHFGGLSCP